MIPVVFDNYTIETIINKSLYERIDKKKVIEAIKTKDRKSMIEAGALARETMPRIDRFEAGYRMALQQVQKELGLDG